MKNKTIILTVILMIIYFLMPKSEATNKVWAQNYLNTTQKVSRNNQSTAKNRMTIAKCIQQGDRIIASAFMLPPNWQVKCNTIYRLEDGKLVADSLFEAQNHDSSIKLENGQSLTFNYNQQLIDMIREQESYSMGSAY
ncbi:MAG TPA: hypothetical protein ENJ44_08405, partial [Oceanospirillales bacterium]|nr:hypothetical protein [Oceanospirillales bacterium]